LLQAVDQRLTAIENDHNQQVMAVESSLEFACAKISSMEAEVSDLKKQLSESHTISVSASVLVGREFDSRPGLTKTL